MIINARHVFATAIIATIACSQPSPDTEPTTMNGKLDGFGPAPTDVVLAAHHCEQLPPACEETERAWCVARPDGTAGWGCRRRIHADLAFCLDRPQPDDLIPTSAINPELLEEGCEDDEELKCLARPDGKYQWTCYRPHTCVCNECASGMGCCDGAGKPAPCCLSCNSYITGSCFGHCGDADYPIPMEEPDGLPWVPVCFCGADCVEPTPSTNCLMQKCCCPAVVEECCGDVTDLPVCQ